MRTSSPFDALGADVEDAAMQIAFDTLKSRDRARINNQQVPIVFLTAEPLLDDASLYGFPVRYSPADPGGDIVRPVQPVIETERLARLNVTWSQPYVTPVNEDIDRWTRDVEDEIVLFRLRLARDGSLDVIPPSEDIAWRMVGPNRVHIEWVPGAGGDAMPVSRNLGQLAALGYWWNWLERRWFVPSEQWHRDPIARI